MAVPVGASIIVPTGALVLFSDGSLGSVPAGTVATPTDASARAGWVNVGPEVVRPSASTPANTTILIDLKQPPLVPASLEISSVDPYILVENGSGTLTGPTGSGGTNTVDLFDGTGSCSFNVVATGPITALYQEFGVAVGTIFTLVDPDGAPLGMGTITLDNGAAVVSEAVPQGLAGPTYEMRTFTIDPDATSPGLSLADDNLDGETLDLIAAQLREVSELEQHEIEITGKNLPWFRRGLAIQITDFHDERGEDVALPPAIILERSLQVTAGQSWLRHAKLIAWTHPGILMPPSTLTAPAGSAATYLERDVWQPLQTYAALDVVLPGPAMTQVRFVAIPFGSAGSLWAFPATSGASTPFGAVLSGRTPPAMAEGRIIIDSGINAWYGVHRVVTLTGAIAGQCLLVRDAGGIEHYLTFYPSVGRWTDTPAPPA